MSRTYRLRHWKNGPVKVKHYVDSRLWVRERQAEEKLRPKPENWCFRGFSFRHVYDPVLPVTNVGYSGLVGWGSLGWIPSLVKKRSRKNIHRSLRHADRIFLKNQGVDWDSIVLEDRKRTLAEDAWNLT